MNFVDTPIPDERSTATRNDIAPGKVCWAKLSSYPWWPSLVLMRRDERIPQSEWRSTETATPVLFFGTAEFSWIDASRNVSPWETDKVARVVKDKSIEFKRALQEATTYINTGTLPDSFSLEALQDRESSQEEGEAQAATPATTGGRRGSYPLLAGDELQLGTKERRRLTVQRQLGLRAPYKSPTLFPVFNPNITSAAAAPGQLQGVPSTSQEAGQVALAPADSARQGPSSHPIFSPGGGLG